MRKPPLKKRQFHRRLHISISPGPLRHTVFTPSALRTSVSVKDSMNQVCTWIVTKSGCGYRCGHVPVASWVKGQIVPRVPVPNFQLGLDFDHDIPELRRLEMGEVKQLWVVFFNCAVRRGLVRLKMAAAVTEELVKDREFGVLYLELSVICAVTKIWFPWIYQ